MPHTSKGFVHFGHDLRRLVVPTQLEQLLPDMTGVPVNHGLWDSPQELMNHDSFVLLWNTIEGLLDDMASKWIHGQAQCITLDCISNGDHLVRRPMLETALNEKVAESIDHQRISLAYDRLDNVKLLFNCSDLEFLLEKDGSLLVIVTDNLVHNVLPVAGDILVQQTTVVQRLQWRHIRLCSETRNLYPSQLFGGCL